MSKNVWAVVALLFSFNIFSSDVKKLKAPPSCLAEYAQDCACCAKCCGGCFCCLTKRLGVFVCCLGYIACKCPCDTISAAAKSLEKRSSEFPKWYRLVMSNEPMKR